MYMRAISPFQTVLFALVIATLQGCGKTKQSGSSPDETCLGSAACDKLDSGSGGVDATGGTGSGGNGAGGTDWQPSTPSLCGGEECGDGEECCLLDHTCFDPSDTAACAIDWAVGKPDGDEPREYPPCASNRDCGADESCQSMGTCGGQGECKPDSECRPDDWCMAENCEVCGCDGVTYPNVGVACRMGVRIPGSETETGACGETTMTGVGGSTDPGDGLAVTRCGTDSNCPYGEVCCTETAQCYDEKHPYLCGPALPGGDQRCVTDDQCLGEDICRNTEPGCEPIEKGVCDSMLGCRTGELVPVCGCNGVTYTHAECAERAGINVDYTGECEL